MRKKNCGLLGILMIFVFSCNNISTTNDITISEKLVGGIWYVEFIKYPMKSIQSGLQFVSNKQVFNIDSQGRTIMSIHPNTFEISGDTLTLVDHRYNKAAIYEKGTEIFIINKLSENRLVLDMIHPQKDNQILLVRKE